MIKKILFLLLVTVAFVNAQFLGPKISSQQNEHNFGDISAGKIVTHNFILTNTGDDYLLIKNVHASCGCTAAKPDKDKLSPGESTNLKVEFNSTGRNGAQHKVVSVLTNDPKTPELKLVIKGNVVPSVAAVTSSPKIYFPQSEYNFGKVKEGKVVEYTFKFANKGNAPLVIQGVKTSCGCTAALLSSKNIEPGQEGTLKVELDTKNRNGKLSRTITIASNDSQQPSKILTISADIEK
jgi:hypothetical protein